jgi:hypothetical protein
MNEVYDPDHREAPVTDLSSASEEISVVGTPLCGGGRYTWWECERTYRLED